MWSEEQVHKSSWKIVDDCEFCVFERSHATIRFFEDTIRPALMKDRLMKLYYTLPPAEAHTRRFGMGKMLSRLRPIVYTIMFIIKLDKMAHGTCRVVKSHWEDEWTGGMHDDSHTEHRKLDDDKVEKHENQSTQR